MLSENVVIDRGRIREEKVLRRLSGGPSLPDRVGNWKADFSVDWDIARYDFQRAGSFELIISRLEHETGYFLEHDDPRVRIKEWSSEEKVSSEGLLDLVDVTDRKSEKEACDLAIDWMIQQQTEEDIMKALEGT